MLKKCIKCGKKKEEGEYRRDTRYPAPRRKTICSDCENIRSREWYCKNKERARLRSQKWQRKNKQKRRASAKRYREKNPEKVAITKISCFYRVSKEEAEILFQRRQTETCNICSLKKKRMVIDHCHIDGVVRGILCDGCNKALGMLGDSLKNIQRVIKYLESTYE